MAALVEGNSVRSTARMTGVSKPTILKLLANLGAACQRYHDATVRAIPAKRVQCDEIWAFCYSKEKNVPEAKRGTFGYGDVWTWTALDPDTKLLVSWLVSTRSHGAAFRVMEDLRDRLANRIQLTTDGYACYLDAVDSWFREQIDYAMLVQLYASAPGQREWPRGDVFIGTKVRTIQGIPDEAHVSTSHVERQNLSMRMGMRRFTRSTNGFSKKVQSHQHAVALYFVHYNFARVHQTLRVTPAMEAGLSDHVWSLEEIVELLET